MKVTEIYTYKAEMDLFGLAKASCSCGSCGWSGRFERLREIGDCGLTPGDASPVGRCPRCDSLAYADRLKDRQRDAAEKLYASIAEAIPELARVGAALDAQAPALAQVVQSIVQHQNALLATISRGSEAPTSASVATNTPARENVAQ